MLYTICPTCGHLLADIEIEFSEKYQKIINSSESDEKKEKDMKKIFIDFKVPKYCCRMRLISYLDHIKVII
jgi:DNA-directed RNA polymerase subunit N (RpoN/RPB10)